MMTCSYCNGLVFWDFPIKPFGNNSTTCQNCNAINSQIIENDEEE